MWSTLDIAGHPVDLFEPGSRPRFALVCLHDADGRTLRDDSAATFLLKHHGFACVCPRGGQSWWSSRACATLDAIKSAESWVVDDVLPAILARWSLAANAIALTGIGMGGQGALRLGFKHPERFPTVAVLDAALDHYELYGEDTPLDEMYNSREQCRQDTAILHIHPVRQPRHIWFAADPASRWFRGSDRLHEKLFALGVAHTFAEKNGDWDKLFLFMKDALETESRRLL